MSKSAHGVIREFEVALMAERPLTELRGAVIRARQAGLSQRELAKCLGTTQSAIARLENGSHLPRLDTLQRLADVLGLEFIIGPGDVLRVRAAHNGRTRSSAKRARPRVSGRPMTADDSIMDEQMVLVEEAP